jgi:hypothetical protein
MKKLQTIIGAVLFTSILITSCGGSSIESDAKKLADIQCKAKDLIQKAQAGDQSVMEESSKLGIEAGNLAKEIEGKYTSESDRKSFDEAYIKAQGNCK